MARRPVGTKTLEKLREMNQVARECREFADAAADHLNNPEYVAKRLAWIARGQEIIRRLVLEVSTGGDME